MNIVTIFEALLTRAKVYLRENWGSPFIMAFMLLFAIAAASVSVGLVGLADDAAIYAYYALLTGITLQLVCFLRYDKRSGEPVNETR